MDNWFRMCRQHKGLLSVSMWHMTSFTSRITSWIQPCLGWLQKVNLIWLSALAQVIMCSSFQLAHIGPHLSITRTAENSVHGHFHERLCLYQSGCERTSRWNLTSGMTSWTQESQCEFVVQQILKNLKKCKNNDYSYLTTLSQPHIPCILKGEQIFLNKMFFPEAFCVHLIKYKPFVPSEIHVCFVFLE